MNTYENKPWYENALIPLTMVVLGFIIYQQILPYFMNFITFWKAVGLASIASTGVVLAFLGIFIMVQKRNNPKKQKQPMSAEKQQKRREVLLIILGGTILLTLFYLANGYWEWMETFTLIWFVWAGAMFMGGLVLTLIGMILIANRHTPAEQFWPKRAFIKNWRKGTHLLAMIGVSYGMYYLHTQVHINWFNYRVWAPIWQWLAAIGVWLCISWFIAEVIVISSVQKTIMENYYQPRDWTWLKRLGYGIAVLAAAYFISGAILVFPLLILLAPIVWLIVAYHQKKHYWLAIVTLAVLLVGGTTTVWFYPNSTQYTVKDLQTSWVGYLHRPLLKQLPQSTKPIGFVKVKLKWTTSKPKQRRVANHKRTKPPKRRLEFRMSIQRRRPTPRVVQRPQPPPRKRTVARRKQAPRRQVVARRAAPQPRPRVRPQRRIVVRRKPVKRRQIRVARARRVQSPVRRRVRVRWCKKTVYYISRRNRRYNGRIVWTRQKVKRFLRKYQQRLKRAYQQYANGKSSRLPPYVLFRIRGKRGLQALSFPQGEVSWQTMPLSTRNNVAAPAYWRATKVRCR